MTRPHPQSHVTHQLRGYMANQNRYISTSTKPMVPKVGRVLTQDEGAPPKKSRDTSILQSHGIFPDPQSLWPPNLAGCWLFCGYYDSSLRRKKLANPSVILFPSFFVKKVYIKYERSRQDATESFCSPNINTKMSTRTKNVEMN